MEINRLGILVCSNKKLSEGKCPAYLMYSPSPRFTNEYIKLKSQTDVVYVLSAKYGLIHSCDRIENYDLEVSALSQEQCEALAKRSAEVIEKLRPKQIVASIPAHYRVLLPSNLHFEEFSL